MAVKNAYPELPELPFERTSLLIADAFAYIASLSCDTQIKRAAYVIFRNESASGTKGINNNYIGLQADGGRQAEKWTPFFAGTCVKNENMTGKPRRFICFKQWKGCLDLLCDKVSDRGLYVGGYAHPYANMQIKTMNDWPLAYWREWVMGDSTANIPADENAAFLKIYRAAIQAFPGTQTVAARRRRVA